MLDTVVGPGGSLQWKHLLVPTRILGAAQQVLMGRSQAEPRPQCSHCSLGTQTDRNGIRNSQCSLDICIEVLWWLLWDWHLEVACVHVDELVLEKDHKIDIKEKILWYQWKLPKRNITRVKCQSIKSTFILLTVFTCSISCHLNQVSDPIFNVFSNQNH